MPGFIQIEEFLQLSENTVIIDVRTPDEFKQGHFPSAINIPLFSNEDRKIVGTIYKQQGRQPAILKGTELAGPKQKDILKAAIELNKNNSFLLYCWRGGMRSASVAWLLELYGFKIFLLKGGYKSFRKVVLKSFSEKRKIIVLGGRTGSNKTNILKGLEKRGEQVIDLEKTASHKGSSFGSFGEDPQPTQEQFENMLAWQLIRSAKEKNTWLEDESRMIGSKVIPEGLWLQMRTSKVIYLDVPFEDRVNNLTALYGQYPGENLIEAIERIKKRLGPQHAKAAIEFINAGELKRACEIVLLYYDKTYDYGINQREAGSVIKCNFIRPALTEIADEIIRHCKEITDP